MIVMKFGGTSNQDAAAMKNVAGIVASHRDRHPIVVISAIARATNVLEQAGRLSAEGRYDDAVRILRELLDRHYAILKENVHEPAMHAEVKAFLDRTLAYLEELCRGISILRELTPRTLDALYCNGELMSSRLVWATLRSSGIHSEWLDTKDFLVTDGSFTAAVPLMDKVTERLRARIFPGINQGTIYVTQGFIGATERGERTTMGRESSDYSAAVIAAAIDADDVQIWTDVDGILTGDPTIIAAPHKVRQMSFQEAYDVSFFGAKVLHPSTMLPALQKNIPIHIFNSRRPGLSGSLVTNAEAGAKHVVKSIAYRNKITMLRISPAQRFSPFIFWEHVYSILTRYGATPRLTVTSEYGLSVALDQKYDLDAIVRDLEGLGSVEQETGKGIVAVVGTRLADDPGMLRRVFACTGECPVNMISFGASKSSLSIVLPEDRIVETVRTLHEEFFGSAIDEQIFERLRA